MTRLLVTRPEADAQESAGRLRALGCLVDMAPLMVFSALDVRLPEADGLSGVIFTSTNGVRALADRNGVSTYSHLPAYAVGDKTAAAATAAGFAEVINAHGDVEALMALLKAKCRGDTFFYPAAAEVARDLAKALAPAGLLVIAAEVYRMQAVAALPETVSAALAENGYDAALFYSRRAAAIFVELTEMLLSPTQRRALTMICLSENVAAPLVSAGFPRIVLADFPSEEAMMAASLSFSRGQITA